MFVKFLSIGILDIFSENSIAFSKIFYKFQLIETAFLPVFFIEKGFYVFSYALRLSMLDILPYSKKN